MEGSIDVAAQADVDAPVVAEVPVVSGGKNPEKPNVLPRLEDIKSGPQMTISTGLFPEVNETRVGKIMAWLGGRSRKKRTGRTA